MGASLIGNSLLLPGPVEVISSLGLIVSSPGFLPILLATLARGLLGFLLSAVLALILGLIAGTHASFGTFISPLIISVRSVPVLAVILLGIIWFKSDMVPLFVCFLIVFPVAFQTVKIGRERIDPHLMEMASIYRFTRKQVILHIVLPEMSGPLITGLSTGLGMSWRAVAAAEILSMPMKGIGTEMQNAQLLLETSSLLAWTLVIILLSALIDLITHSILKKSGANL